MVYIPVRFPKLGGFESPLAQAEYRKYVAARYSGQLHEAQTCFQRARRLEREFQLAVQVRFSC